VRVLLTGASGFIGSHVARELVAGGDAVTAVIAPASSLDPIADLGVAGVVRADLRSADLDRLVEACRPEVCVHLAWYVEPGRYLTEARPNLESLAASVRLLTALEGGTCRRVVLAGTCLEGATGEDGRPVTSTSPYAATKAALHSVATHLEVTDVVCAHIFHVYGPGERRERIVPQVALACLQGQPLEVTSGDRQFDYLHVEDVASALATIAKARMIGQVDVCSGQRVALRELFDEIGRAAGHRGMIKIGARPDGEEMIIPGGDPRVLADVGWSPRWTLEEGVVQTVAWWRGVIERERKR
jgi:nucleoside-diphosphate-sugar epimerase